jgi:hypothetical protein
MQKIEAFLGFELSKANSPKELPDSNVATS